jgi:HPt (histidine-containing phosphotransfer) domain-containing protein
MSLDQDTLGSLRELASPDQPDFLKQILTLFQDAAPARVHAIQTALGQGDHATIAREAHTLKSSSANIGALELSSICQNLEKAARSPDAASVSILIAQECAKLQPALDAALASIAQLPEMQ